MNSETYTDPGRRHDFVLLFDVTDGNPNGDPDAGNLPRVDPETMQGLVSDVCLKRKVRDYVAMVDRDAPGRMIFVGHGDILAGHQRKAYESVGAEPALRTNEKAREYMCATYYDVRMFGAVMTTGKSGQKKDKKELQWNCGQVRGPVQLTFARSISAIVPMDVSVTRVALTNADDVDRAVAGGDDGDEKAASGQMGRKALVPYGLYRAHGFFSAPFAAKTGVKQEDLALFWDALRKMWDLDRSASRGMMSLRGLYIFTHDSPLGNAPAQDLFARVQVSLRPEVTTPRSFADYVVAVDWPGEGAVPGVCLHRLVG